MAIQNVIQYGYNVKKLLKKFGTELKACQLSLGDENFFPSNYSLFNTFILIL